MSLSAITLSIFRRRLVSGGVRLGFLTGGYRVGDWAYLCRSAFRQQSLDRSRPWELLLSGLLVFATIMSTLAGPASAVLLVPTLGWYGFHGKIAFENITLPLVYYNTSHEVWTTHLRDDIEQYTSCKLMDKTMIDSPWCPGSGYSELIDWAAAMGATDLANNLTFQSTSTEIRRYLNITQRGDTTLSTTPPHFVMNSIGLFQQFIDTTYVGAVSNEPRYRLKSQGAASISRSSSLYAKHTRTILRIRNLQLCTLWISSALEMPSATTPSRTHLHQRECGRVRRIKTVVGSAWNIQHTTTTPRSSSSAEWCRTQWRTRYIYARCWRAGSRQSSRTIHG